jgi:hypothetical protein
MWGRSRMVVGAVRCRYRIAGTAQSLSANATHRSQQRLGRFNSAIGTMGTVQPDTPYDSDFCLVYYV